MHRLARGAPSQHPEHDGWIAVRLQALVAPFHLGLDLEDWHLGWWRNWQGCLGMVLTREKCPELAAIGAVKKQTGGPNQSLMSLATAAI